MVQIPDDVAEKLRAVINTKGDSGFFKCSEDGLERQLLFTKDKLKLRDKSGRNTLIKDTYPTVSMTIAPDSPQAFTLVLTSRKGQAAGVQLLADSPFTRDLIYLILKAYRDAGGGPAPRATPPGSRGNSFLGKSRGGASTPSDASSPQLGASPAEAIEQMNVAVKGSGKEVSGKRRTLSFGFGRKKSAS